MLKSASEMQSFMELHPTDDADELADRLGKANVYIALSGKLLADAKSLQDDALTSAFERYGSKVEKLGAQMGGKVLMAYCKDESFLVNWFDRINRGLVHSTDNIRTLISFAKENMRINRFADNPR